MGLQNGFKVGADRSKAICPSLEKHAVSPTPPSGGRETRQGRMLGPFPLQLFRTTVQSIRIGVIPKGQTGKWRLIMDLPYPPMQA